MDKNDTPQAGDTAETTTIKRPAPGEKFHLDDTVLIHGKVEHNSQGAVGVIIATPTGDGRMQVLPEAIRHHERGPIKSGERVLFDSTEGKKTVRKSGIVRHVYQDDAWVKVGDEDLIMNSADLRRAE